MDRKPHTNTLQASVQDARAATDSTIPAKILTSQIPKFWQRCQNQFWIFELCIFGFLNVHENPKSQNSKTTSIQTWFWHLHENIKFLEVWILQEWCPLAEQRHFRRNTALLFPLKTVGEQTR